MSDINKEVIEEFRANEGQVGGFFAGKSLVLLHTTGAKSGKERVNPLVTIEDGGRLIVIASKGGAPTNPDWYYNVVANPMVSVEYGKESYQAHATIASEPERTGLFDKMVGKYRFFADYAENTTRVIPVVILSHPV